MQELRNALPTAAGEHRDNLEYELRHLEHRLSALEDKTYLDQSDYYDAVKQRERVWREWRGVHQEAQEAGMGHRRAYRNRLDELRQKFRTLVREVDEEYHRALARDMLALDELRSQGVLTPEALHPSREQTPPEQPRRTGNDAHAAAEPPPDQARQAERPQQRRWMSALPPYPPAQAGLLGQADMAQPDAVKSERTYVDPTFSTAGLPGGVLSHADLSRSSFAEVEFTGVHRYLGCKFAATDLRRIEMRRAASAHIFQDCNLHGASLAQAHLAGVVFRRCDLSRTHWRSARLDRVKFESCTLDGVQWEGVDLSRTVMSNDMLAAADFQFASKPPLNLMAAEASPPELTTHGATPQPTATAQPPPAAQDAPTPPPADADAAPTPPAPPTADAAADPAPAAPPRSTAPPSDEPQQPAPAPAAEGAAPRAPED